MNVRKRERVDNNIIIYTYMRMGQGKGGGSISRSGVGGHDHIVMGFQYPFAFRCRSNYINITTDDDS